MNNGKILQKNSDIDLNGNHQCYLLNKDHLFFFEGHTPRLQYQGQHVELSRKQAKILRQLCQAQAPVKLKSLIQSHGPNNLDKHKVMQLVFELNNKFRHMGLPQGGISLNGEEYQLNYQATLSNELEYELQRMRKQKLWIRLFIFTAMALMLVLNFMP